MPNFIIGQYFEIYANGADLADALDSFQPTSETDELDTTKLGNDGNRSFIPTQNKGTLTMQGCFEHDETTSDKTENILRAAFDNKTAVKISASLGAITYGGQAFLLDAVQTSLKINSTPSGLVMVDISATGSGGVKRGVWTFKQSVDAGEVDGTVVDNAVATTNGGLFHAHTYNPGDADAATAQFIPQHSSDNVTYADLPTIPSFLGGTASAFSYLVPAGTTINRYLRTKFITVGGLAYGVAAFSRY